MAYKFVYGRIRVLVNAHDCVAASGHHQASSSITQQVFCFFETTSQLHSLGWPRAHFVEQPGFQFTDPPASASPVVELECIIITGYMWLLRQISPGNPSSVVALLGGQ